MKNKTHKGMRKRVKVTGSGRVVHRHAFSSHLFTKKSSKRKRKFRKDVVLAGAGARKAKDLMGI